jgi:hypothetical protein
LLSYQLVWRIILLKDGGISFGNKGGGINCGDGSFNHDEYVLFFAEGQN